jgi:PilZ domain
MNDSLHLERRSTQRFAIHAPVCIQSRAGNSQRGLMQDISTSGMLFYADLPLNVGEIVELNFVMPEVVTLGEQMRVRAMARILRVLPPIVGTQSGIAVHMESYEFLPEAAFSASALPATRETESAAHEELSVTANTFPA